MSSRVPIGVAPASKHPNRIRLDPGTPARVNPASRHEIYLNREDFLHARLQRYQIEQCETLRSRKIEKHVNVRGVVGLVAGDRAEDKKRADPGIAKLRFVLLQ